MPPEPGKPKRKPPERGDALNINLPFEDAIRAALNTAPQEPTPNPRTKKSKKGA